MIKKICVVLLLGTTLPAGAQRLLTLDSCRQMALRNNKQIRISKVKQEVAENVRRSARTKYLPHVSAIGTYEHTSKEISILNESQKTALGNIGTSLVGGVQEGLSNVTSQLPMQNIAGLLGTMGISMEGIQTLMNQSLTQTAGQLNEKGQNIVDAFRTDTRNIWAGSVMVLQPVFLGGALIAMNKMADITEDLAANSAEAKRQATLYNIDQAYWQVVSLTHKKKLAEGYLDLIKKLDSDVTKMIEEGVATRSDGLSVSVKVNEAEMAVTKVNDGLVLSKMLLCQLCGLPVDEQITLADEYQENIAVVTVTPQLDVEKAVAFRPELVGVPVPADVPGGVFPPDGVPARPIPGAHAALESRGGIAEDKMILHLDGLGRRRRGRHRRLIGILKRGLSGCPGGVPRSGQPVRSPLHALLLEILGDGPVVSGGHDPVPLLPGLQLRIRIPCLVCRAPRSRRGYRGVPRCPRCQSSGQGQCAFLCRQLQPFLFLGALRPCEQAGLIARRFDARHFVFLL